MSPRNSRNRFSSYFNTVVRDLITSWGRLVEDAHSLQQGNVPDLSLTLAESQMLRRQWQADEPSYLRTYLDNGMWGKDTLWDGLVRHAFTMFICMYLLPSELAEKLLLQLRANDQMPEMESIQKFMPAEQDLSSELESIHRRAEEANQNSHSRKPAPGSQHCQALPGARDLLPGPDSRGQPGSAARSDQV